MGQLPSRYGCPLKIVKSHTCGILCVRLCFTEINRCCKVLVDYPFKSIIYFNTERVMCMFTLVQHIY